MKLVALAMVLAAFGSTAQARPEGGAARGGGGAGWTGIVVEKIERTNLTCKDATGITFRLSWVREVSNAGDGINERHDVFGAGRGWNRGSQSLDVRGKPSADGLDLELMNYGTRSYEGAPVLATIKGELSAARFEGQIKMSHDQVVNGPLVLNCTLEQK